MVFGVFFLILKEKKRTKVDKEIRVMNKINQKSLVKWVENQLVYQISLFEIKKKLQCIKIEGL